MVTISKENTTKYHYSLPLNTQLIEFDYTHKEDSYLDYERDALTPENLSTEGPSIVHADFNADGLEDLFR